MIARPLRCAQGGFSLIELMITVSIVGVLAAIAIPAYSAYVLQSHRSEAVNSLTGFRTALERCYSQNFTYVNAATTPCPAATGAAVNTPNGYYSLAFVITPNSYNIVASALGNQTKDTNCATMTIFSTGQQAATNSGGADSTQICWSAK